MAKGRMTLKEERLYNAAMKQIDDLVEEVFSLCDRMAAQNDYEPDWVLERFREKFNAAKRERC